MSGKIDLSELLRELKPILHDGEYVFVTIDKGCQIDLANVIATFSEKEGTTLILKREHADELGLTYTYVAAWITLSVQSSLEAVGLTAAVADILAKNQISCNVVAAYYHDHIFVDKKDGQRAIEVLEDLKYNIIPTKGN